MRSILSSRRFPRVCLALLATLALSSPTWSSEAATSTLPAIPTLKVETLDHGSFDLSAKRGGWVVVNFWATWCAPCLKEIPDLSDFHDRRTDAEVIGLAFEEIEPEEMRAFLRERPASYPIALVDVYQPPADFATPRGLPMTYLIDPEGKVAKRFLGPVTSAELEAVIDASGVTPAAAESATDG